MATLYWVHLPEHTDMFKEGYIGVTPNLQKRIREHKHKFKAYANQLIIDTIVIAEQAYCYSVEKMLRPIRNIGWNKAIGGYRNNIMIGIENPNFGKFGKQSPNYKGSYVCPMGEYDRPKDIAELYKITESTVIRKCKGSMINGKFLQPQNGWAFKQKDRVAS